MCRSSATASTAAIRTRSIWLCVFDLEKRTLLDHHRPAALHRPAYAQARAGRADLHHLREQRRGRGDRSARPTRWSSAIDSGSTNGHRLIISPDGQRLYTENEEDATISVIDLPKRKLLGKIKTPRPLAGIAISADGRTVVAVDDARADAVPDRHRSRQRPRRGACSRTCRRPRRSPATRRTTA